jgi:hypothetical protein
VTGGNRPTFVSGGAQGDRMRNHWHKLMSGTSVQLINSGNISPYTAVPAHSVMNPTGDFMADYVVNRFCINGVQNAINTPIGDDNAPTNVSVRFWRRIA